MKPKPRSAMNACTMPCIASLPYPVAALSNSHPPARSRPPGSETAAYLLPAVMTIGHKEDYSP